MCSSRSRATETVNSRSRPDRAPPVLRLLFSRRPAAVFWRIRAVIIDAIKRESWVGTLAHILKEVLETMPTLANEDPARPIARIRRVRRTFAPALHLAPDSVLGGLRVPVAQPWVALRASAVAAAGRDLAFCQHRRRVSPRLPAFADAFPFSPSSAVRGNAARLPPDHQSPETLTGHKGVACRRGASVTPKRQPLGALAAAGDLEPVEDFERSGMAEPAAVAPIVPVAPQIPAVVSDALLLQYREAAESSAFLERKASCRWHTSVIPRFSGYVYFPIGADGSRAYQVSS